MALDHAKSVEQAELLAPLNFTIMALDKEYLAEWIEAFDKQNSFNESALILHPNPRRQMALNDLNRVKAKQLRLILQLRENLEKLIDVEGKVKSVEQHTELMNKLFAG